MEIAPKGLMYFYRIQDVRGQLAQDAFYCKKRDESGNVTHVLCTVHSISDSKRREENLNFASKAAKREAEMKTRFLATMSHDIRTPLNGIIGMVNMENQYVDDPQMQQKIRKIDGYIWIILIIVFGKSRYLLLPMDTA